MLDATPRPAGVLRPAPRPRRPATVAPLVPSCLQVDMNGMVYASWLKVDQLARLTHVK